MRPCYPLRRLVIAGTLVLSAVCAPHAWAPPPICWGTRLEQLCRHAHFVFVGKTVTSRESYNGRMGKGQGEGLEPVVLEVLQQFRGHLPERVTVYWDFGSWPYGGGTHYAQGETYLVMTFSAEGDPPLCILSCGATCPAKEALGDGWLNEADGHYTLGPKLNLFLDNRLSAHFEYGPLTFEHFELKIEDPLLRAIPDTQVHDAYDADRDGTYVSLCARIRHDDGQEAIVPGFAMKEQADGPWLWRVRWAPLRPGAYRITLMLDARVSPDSAPTRIERELLDIFEAGSAARFLLAPQKGENPRYLRRLKPDGASEAVWLFGACRAWVVKSQDPNNDWSPHEWLDRETELLAPMREGGFNLLNQWMSPWEFLLIHHDRAEFWQQDDGSWKREPLPEDAAWTPYQCYDQGRAAAFDKLVQMCEGDWNKPPVHLLLSPLPHQCLQLKEHPWGAQESGWSPENDAGKQTMERLNGLSAFRAPGGPEYGPEGMPVWDFFQADPSAPLDDWRSQLFDHQANFCRYVIARWGYSRAIGLWVLIDELDAIGDEVGVMSEKKGWWAHPQCDRWLADMVRMFHGDLKRSDGMAYQGDPFHHPVHAATTSFGGQAGKGSNLEWTGGPPGARPDLFGWHWYPSLWALQSWEDLWAYTIDGVARYASAPIGQAPRLISEFGAPDRREAGDEPSALYPSLWHFAAWAAVFSGQAGTPMDWDDGKEFGELRWRTREGIFDREHYPIDHIEQLQALRRFLGDLNPDALMPCSGPDARVHCFSPDGQGASSYALYDTRTRNCIYGWVFTTRPSASIVTAGLPAGNYIVSWYDPWTGELIPDLPPTRVQVAPTPKQRHPFATYAGRAQWFIGAMHLASFDATPALAKLREGVPKFPDESRLDRGHDVAFKLVPAAVP